MRKSLSVVLLTVAISFLNAQIVINEVGEPYDMPNTWGDSYVELYNTTDASIDVSGWAVWSTDVSR